MAGLTKEQMDEINSLMTGARLEPWLLAIYFNDLAPPRVVIDYLQTELDRHGPMLKTEYQGRFRSVIASLRAILQKE